MNTTQILSVEKFPLPKSLLGCHIDLPTAGFNAREYKFEFAGWALGKDSHAIGIELVANDGPVRRIPILQPRPDVWLHYPLAANRAVGFWAPVCVLGMTPQFELIVQAVLEDKRRVPIASIRGKHEPLSLQPSTGLRPLIVTSLGRTGTTWLMRLLAHHPAIVAYRAYPYEIRPGRYWMQLLSAITEPAAHAQSSDRLGTLDSQWWVAHHPFSNLSPVTDSRLREWFGLRFVKQAAAFSQGSLEQCYREIAAIQEQPAPVYFAEKHLHDEIPGIVWEVYPNAREIFLVRDFRDMLCSIYAFNRKRGTLGFGRSLASNESEYIAYVQAETLRLLTAWQNRRHRVCLVRYEDLIEQPLDALSNMLQYLGLDASPSILDGMLHKAAIDTAELRRHRTSETMRDSVGRWRRDLDPTLHQLCLEAFGTTLEKFGYAPETAHVG